MYENAITPATLAATLGIKASAILLELMRSGRTVTLNQPLACDEVALLVRHGLERRCEPDATELLRELLAAREGWNPGGNLHARNPKHMAAQARLDAAWARARQHVQACGGAEPQAPGQEETVARRLAVELREWAENVETWAKRSRAKVLREAADALLGVGTGAKEVR